MVLHLDDLQGPAQCHGHDHTWPYVKWPYNTICLDIAYVSIVVPISLRGKSSSNESLNLSSRTHVERVNHKPTRDTFLIWMVERYGLYATISTHPLRDQHMTWHLKVLKVRRNEDFPPKKCSLCLCSITSGLEPAFSKVLFQTSLLAVIQILSSALHMHSKLCNINLLSVIPSLIS